LAHKKGNKEHTWASLEQPFIVSFVDLFFIFLPITLSRLSQASFKMNFKQQQIRLYPFVTIVWWRLVGGWQRPFT